MANERTARPEYGHLELLVLTVGARRFFLPLVSVREVRAPSPVAQVPWRGDVAPGVLVGRGAALTVVSLASLLGVEQPVAMDQQWVVVLDDPAEPLALAADPPADIVVVSRDELREASGPGDAMFAAIAPDGTPVLDVAAILRDLRFPVVAGAPSRDGGLR